VFRFRGFYGAVNDMMILRSSTLSDSIWVKFMCPEDAGTICMEKQSHYRSGVAQRVPGS